MKRFLLLLAIPFFLLLASSCTEDGLVDRTSTPEMYYVDLLYALHQHDQAGAKAAADGITKIIGQLPVGNYATRRETEREGIRFHISRAQSSFFEVQALIKENDLDKAMTVLNLATNTLAAAHIPGYEDFYIGRIHDFLSTWMEVTQAFDREEFSSRDWRVAKRRVKSAHNRWRESRWVQPSPSAYYFSPEDTAEFEQAHGEIDRLLESLKSSLSADDEVLSKSYVVPADVAIWALVRSFGSPERGVLDPVLEEELAPSR